MNIKQAKQEIINTVQAYLTKDETGEYAIPVERQRPVLLIGPPGIGKNAIMEQVAQECGINLVSYTITHHTRQSAIGLPFISEKTYGGKNVHVTEYTMSEIIASVYDRIRETGLKEGILFIDEIHRFNKGQQDYLLPFVEDGTVILIGATTENPYFEVNSALISRSSIFQLKPLSKENIKTLIRRAVTDTEKGMGSYDAEITEEAVYFLADMSEGDARHALNAVELGILSTERNPETGKIVIDLPVAEECIQRRSIRYDKDGDNHYDIISAFIKSMRGSDPDAAVYYLAKMLDAGEDIKFIARRIMICASEDVGNADPQALVMAVNASLAVERVGMPEAQIILAEAATYVACAPKSNSSYEAVFAAMKTVGSVRTSVPPHLQDAHYKGSAKLGHGEGYQYAHDYPNHYVEQQYLPDEILGSRFLHLGTNGYEQKIRENFKKIGKDIE